MTETDAAELQKAFLVLPRNGLPALDARAYVSKSGNTWVEQNMA